MGEEREAKIKKLCDQAWHEDGVKRVWLYKKAAGLGSAEAMRKLYEYYLRGAFTSLKKAYEWLYKAAKAGHPKSQFELYEAWQKGSRFAPKTRTEAISWCRKAAENGYAKAMYEMSVLYAEGKMVNKDLAESFAWCKKAAEADPDQYWASIASRYYHGEGTPADLTKAYEWVKDRKVKSTLSWPGNLWDEIRKAYEEREKQQLTEQARTGDAAVQLAFAKKLLDKDEGVEARKWLEKAAKQGSGEAMLLLGDSISQNPAWSRSAAMKKEAARWYEKAAQQGMSGAEEKWTAVRAEIKQIRADAAAKLERFCDCLKRGQEGDPEALADLVQCCEEGLGTDQSEKNANYFALRLASIDFPEDLPRFPEIPEASIASFGKARALERSGRDFERASDFYVEAASYGNAEAMRRAANLYRRVIHDYTFEPGNIWWERAKAAGDPFAAENLMAIAVLAEQGDPEACVYLGNAYLHTRRDSIRHGRAEQMGLFWLMRGISNYKRLAQHGDAEAQYQLYRLYDMDELKNDKEKMRWANQAIDSRYGIMLYDAASDQTFEFADLTRSERIAWAKEALAAGVGAAEDLLKLFRAEAERDAMFAEYRSMAQPKEDIVEEEMRKYREDLDERERMFNLMIGQGYETNEESFYVFGKKTMDQYFEDSWPRDMLESMHRKKLEEYYK